MYFIIIIINEALHHYSSNKIRTFGHAVLLLSLRASF